MSIFALHPHGPCGNRRDDLEAFRASKFELQIKYADGWRTVKELRYDLLRYEWIKATKRWPSFRMRVLRDGKRIHGN